MKKWLVPVLFVGFFLYYWLRMIVFLDTDFGWHVRMGEIILSTGFPATDPFSYTMPSYPVIDHGWGIDVFIASLLPLLGYHALAFVFALPVVAALCLAWQMIPVPQRKFALLPLFLVGMSLGLFLLVRPLVFSWLFFVLVYYVCRDWSLFARFRFVLPVLFAFWANLHGGFPMGLVVLAVACWYWWWQKKSSLLSSGVLFACCLLATLFTPYGYNLWWEVWTSMSDGSLRWIIQEWMPAFFSFALLLWTYIFLSALLFLRYRKRFTLFEQVLYIALLIATIMSIRHAPYWLLVSLPITTVSLAFFIKEVHGLAEGKRRLAIAVKGFVIILALFFLQDAITVSSGLGLFGKYDPYPIGGITYLREHLPKGEIFAPYNWGGYFIWQLPEKKVFVDGRMPSWRWHASSAESTNAFGEYRAFQHGEIPFEEVTQKYTISTLVFPTTKPPREEGMTEWFILWSNHIFAFPLPESMLFAYLEKEAKAYGWKEVYRDKTVVIYQDLQLEKAKP